MFEGCVKRFTFFPCLNGVKPGTNNSNEAYALSQLRFGSELLKRPEENDLGAHDSFNFYCLYMNPSWIHCKKMRGIWLAWRAVCNTIDSGCRFCIKIISLNAWVHFVLKSWKTLYLKHSKALANSFRLVSETLAANKRPALLSFGWVPPSRRMGQSPTRDGPGPRIRQPAELAEGSAPPGASTGPLLSQGSLRGHLSSLIVLTSKLHCAQWPLAAPGHRDRVPQGGSNLASRPCVQSSTQLPCLGSPAQPHSRELSLSL